jgi:hypothetical protein
MKKIISALASVLIITTGAAQESGIGVGLSDMGLEGKYWIGAQALAIHIPLNLNSALAIDYLLKHDANMLNITDNSTPVYYGAGVSIGTKKSGDSSSTGERADLHLAVRGVVGIAYYVESLPLDIYFDFSPSVGLLGGTKLGIGSTFGFRYFF